MNRAKFKFTWVYEGSPEISKVFDVNFIEDGCVKEFHDSLPSFMVTRFRQQLIGIKDKNGIELCEGDICVNENGRIAEVIWFESGACFDFIALNEIGDNYGYSAQMARYKLAVIGNIYQNKNLIDNS